MGAALVAFFLLSGDLGAPASVTSEAGSLETPGGPGFAPGIFAFQASVASESRAGETPFIAGEAPRSFVAEILIPRLTVELRNPGVIFSAWYSPRIFWEYPNPSSVSGQAPTSPPASEPLILHMFGLTLDARTSRNVAVAASATGSIGEPDYTTLPQVLGTVQAMLPNVVHVAAVNGQAKVVDKLTERWAVSLAGMVSHWQWLDILPGTVTPAMITSQTLVSGEPAAAFLLTPNDLLGLGAALGWVSYSYGAGAFTVTPATTWKRHLDRGADLNLKLGLTYLHLIGSPPPGATPLLAAGKTYAFSPIGSAELILHLARRDETLFLGRAFAGIDYYLDPVVGTALPRASVSAELTALSVPGWTTTLRGDFATVLQSVPVLPGAIPPDETAFSVSLGVRRRVTENFYAELGGRWANRGPALDTPGFQFNQRQLWAYLSLMGTTRPIPRTGLPR